MYKRQNYCLIFGNFGAPALGITGAAVATLISRIAEFLLVVLYVLFSRRVPLMPRQFLRLSLIHISFIVARPEEKGKQGRKKARRKAVNPRNLFDRMSSI